MSRVSRLAGSIQIPQVAVSLAGLCHRFSKNISGELIYMRPVNWVQYKDVNNDKAFHSVFLNILGFTGKLTLPVSRSLSVYVGAGPALLTRLGTMKGDSVILKGTSYLTLPGGGD